jgi:lysophospholipase L1-like esterase
MILLLLLLFALPAAPQSSALLSRVDSVKICQQIASLLDSTSVAVPDLGKAASVLVQNAHQDVETLASGNNYDHSAILYRFLTSVRVYLELADALPKPYPFAEEAQQQLATLRAAQNRLEAHFRALLDSKEQRLRTSDRDNLARYRDANRSLGPPKAGEPRVVFFGDSITDLWHLNEYFGSKAYVNRGIGGQITGEMLGRMKADVIDLKPAAMVLLAGTNDIGRGIPLAAIESNLTMIADLATAYHIKPVLASVLPVSDYHKDQDPSYARTPLRPPATILELNKWIQELCKLRGFVYLDYFPALVDDKGQIKAELADDGLHPNADGYRIMAPLAQAAIDRTVTPEPPPQKRRRLFGK